MTTLHLVALPHTQTTAAFSSCAYTQKVVKAAKMWRQQGHKVVLYGPEVNDAECDEHVVIVTERERAGWFGGGFDTVLTPFDWDETRPYWQVANERAAQAVRERADRRDLLCLTTSVQHPVAEANPALTACEWAVGYEGIRERFRAFESSAWMHHVYGLRQQRTGCFYDTVIPNFFDRDQFPRAGDGTGGYVAFLGRLIERKGPHVALQLAERVGKKLLVAGPGAIDHGPGYVTAPGVELRGNVEYVGEFDPVQRYEFLAAAEAVICATLYLEPFGGVAVEAMLAGTPVVATDFGAFRETVQDGVTGYRFHTLADGAQALDRATRLDRRKVRRAALARYSLEAVGPMFDRWFAQLDDLWDGGWDA